MVAINFAHGRGESDRARMLPPNLHQPVARVQRYELSLIGGASERNGTGSKLRLGLPARDDAMRTACRVKVISQRADSSKKVYIGAECFEIFCRRGTFLTTVGETMCKAEQFLSSKHLTITARFNFAALNGVLSAAACFSDVDLPGARSLLWVSNQFVSVGWSPRSPSVSHFKD